MLVNQERGVVMEYFWYIVAALGAGVGTGLAGLSAATVMVPILIVLCPSFSGETGAYQATAIALASDILGSAVTAWTYARHKNIDLKRGWIMLVCILAMCTAGSYVAFIVGNVVLGSFTLFLTFFIGIRFLLKPDTSRKAQAGKGEKRPAEIEHACDEKGVTLEAVADFRADFLDVECGGDAEMHEEINAGRNGVGERGESLGADPALGRKATNQAVQRKQGGDGDKEFE